jgi:hypothetical protein
MNRLWKSVVGAFLLAMALGATADAGPRRWFHRPRPWRWRRPPVRRVVVPRPRRVTVLPVGWVSVRVGGAAFFYCGGTFYRRDGAAYVVATAPVGAVVAALPAGYTTFYVGPKRYYYFRGTYFVDHPRGYIVVATPPGAPVP